MNYKNKKATVMSVRRNNFVGRAERGSRNAPCETTIEDVKKSTGDLGRKAKGPRERVEGGGELG